MAKAITRRGFLAGCGSTVAALGLAARVRGQNPPDLGQCVEKVHEQVWRRFIDRHDLMIDFADPDGAVILPTPQDCRDCMPNALGWWSPIENGPMFNGLYMDAMCQRARRTGRPEDAARAQRLATGLLFAASVGKTRGFIARGVATDGESHYPMGSNDQTFPWLHGLWQYLQSGLVKEPLRGQIIAKMVEVAEVLERTGWRMPCDGGPCEFRGTFARPTWECAPRLLFLCKAMHRLTGQARWERLYRQYLSEPADGGQTRLDLCARGMVFHDAHRSSWTGAVGVIGLRSLWEMEDDPGIKKSLALGLDRSAELGAGGIELYKKFDPAKKLKFERDWRLLKQWWRPQTSEADAVALAEQQSRELGKLSPRRGQELLLVREPLFASWVVTLCPNRKLVEQHIPAIKAAIAHYPCEELYYSQFFAAACAGERLLAG